jgi:hypothetical protein
LEGEIFMNNKLKNTTNNKAEDGKFPKKNIKHSPTDESSRAEFGVRGKKDL